MVSDLPTLFAAQKTLAGAPGWVLAEADRLTLVSPVDIDGVTIEGLRFRVNTIQSEPDANVTCQLEYFPPVGKGGPIARVDWRPFHRHSNKMRGPHHLRNILISSSHHHSFDLNWNDQNQAMLKHNLPIATPIDPDPQDIGSLLAFVEKVFRISNAQSLPVPPWKAGLL
jgi:hypothetical protein